MSTNTMTFKFTIQPYQTDAVSAVVDVFKGQGRTDPIKYIMEYQTQAKQAIQGMIDNSDREYEVFSNLGPGKSWLDIDNASLMQNIHTVQSQNNIKLSKELYSGLGAVSLDVEMETGTGKTYVYIKTIFELNRRYGWCKFIIVVPSIAIREGVLKSLKCMQDHFKDQYGKSLQFFAYDSKNLQEIDDFSKSEKLSVMVINIQAFNARGKDARRIRTSLDDFHSLMPIQAIQANRPVLILDEPQKMSGKATMESLKEFNPLFCINYSATHKNHHNLVYALDALDAYNKRLVKKIEVKGLQVSSIGGSGGYIFMESFSLSSSSAPKAVLEFEVAHKGGAIRQTRTVSSGADIFELSKKMEQYKGWKVGEIDPVAGCVKFTNGEVIHPGEAIGDVSESDIRRIQIHETIRSHFAKEEGLFARGIKTLSLFFIDEVAKYRRYDEDGNEANSLYGGMFEEEYDRIKSEVLANCDNAEYRKYLESIDAHSTHAGYFSIDKKGRKVDSSIARGGDSSDDVSAYDLILKDKERLLSLDNPVRFIFSHSALREGWDNPNVFQICTLKQGGSSSVQKRQEVGRGLRICVNQEGTRMDESILGEQVHDINRLTVIASEGYSEFVADLQKGIKDDLYERPKSIDDFKYFIGKKCKIEDATGISFKTISEDQGRKFYRYLIQNNYIDEYGKVTDKYRSDSDNGSLAEVPDTCKELEEGLHNLVNAVYNEKMLPIPDDGFRSWTDKNRLNDNFKKKEFQELWSKINKKCIYLANFETSELVDKVIKAIDANLNVAKRGYAVEIGDQKENLTFDMIADGDGFVHEHSSHMILNYGDSAATSRYDLIGRLASDAKITRRTAVSILSKISPDKFAMYALNPDDFIKKVSRIICEQKASIIVEHIEYHEVDEVYTSTEVFATDKDVDLRNPNVYKAKRNVQNYIVTDGYAKDGKNVERTFSEELDIADEVCVYAKIPKGGFKIPTPLGDYSPDWAIAFNSGSVRHIFFVAETKGSMSSLELRGVEQKKIECAKKLFESIKSKGVSYGVVTSYKELLELVR